MTDELPPGTIIRDDQGEEWICLRPGKWQTADLIHYSYEELDYRVGPLTVVEIPVSYQEYVDKWVEHG